MHQMVLLCFPRSGVALYLGTAHGLLTCSRGPSMWKTDREAGGPSRA